MTRLFKIIALALGLSVSVQAAVPVGDAETQLTVEQGVQKLVRQAGGIARVAVGDPAIADVNVIAGRDLLVTGKSLGITSLMVWPSGKAAPVQYRVRVVAASDPARTAVMDPELAKAGVEPGQQLDGQLPNLLAHRRARLAALNGKELVDRSSVNLESQVMTEVRIAEVSRRTLQQFGLNVLRSSGNTLAGLSPPGALSGIQSGSGSFAPFASSSGLLPVQNAFNLVIGNPLKGLVGVLSLLEQKGLARTLAEPSLTAMSGQTANFLAGGEFPVPVSQGAAAGGSVTIQYKEFGVRLSLTPTVLSRERIALKIAPEVSDLDFSAGIQVGGVSVPALIVRRTDTTVELGDGESFVISGLVSNTLLSNVDKVPWLGDLPVIGAFFRASRLQRNEKELIMVVTPHLVRPLAKGARTPALPGAKYDNYRPGIGSFIFLENGDYDTTPFGYSR